MASPANSSPLTAVLLLLFCSAMAAPPEPASECVSELVTFSPCLAFVSAPPNNLSNTVSRECCSAFSATLSGNRNGGGGGGGGGACLCYLLRQPLMLGFPLNQNRVLDLPSSCDLDDQSLEALCSGSEATSPSQNETDSRISNPPDSAPSCQPSPSSSPPESDNSAKPPSSVNDITTTTEQAPPPETAPRQPLPTRPRPAAQTPSRLPSLFSSAAPAHRSKIWSQMGIITTTMVLLSHQRHLSSLDSM